MTYARLEDDFPENPKIVGLSDAAFRLYITALCYCSRNRTDGFIPAGAMKRLGGKSRTTMELTAAALWHGEAGPVAGWRIHDYEKYQRLRDEIDAISHSKAVAGAKGAAIRWDGKRDGKQMHRVQSTEAATESSPDPEIISPPLPPASGGSAERAERARNGSRRRRDVAALDAIPKDYEGSVERMRARVGRRA